jgi:hypothetical protein
MKMTTDQLGNKVVVRGIMLYHPFLQQRPNPKSLTGG